MSEGHRYTVGPVLHRLRGGFNAITARRSVIVCGDFGLWQSGVATAERRSSGGKRRLAIHIPVEEGDDAAGTGKRTTFTANTSRFNFEMRTPTGAGQLRTFIEGDFFGVMGLPVRLVLDLLARAGYPYRFGRG